MYCIEPEKIENFEKAKAENFKGWVVHHRLQTCTSDGERRLVDITPAELKALDMYYNRPPEELIYLRKGEHSTLHQKGKYAGENNPMYGKHHTEEAKKKQSEAKKGKPSWNKGKQFSDEAKKKMSENHKDVNGENNPMYGKHWYHNDIENVACYECPPGYEP